MMTCEQARRWLPAHVLGEMEEADRPALAEHLASCEACRREEARAAQTLSALRALPEMPPSALRKERALAAAKGLDSIASPARPRRLPAILTVAALLAIWLFGRFVLTPQAGPCTWRVESANGELLRQEGLRWEYVYEGDSLGEDAAVRVSMGRATLRSSRGDRIVLDADSQVHIARGGPNEDRVQLERGRFYCEVAPRTGRRLVVRTPVGRVEGESGKFEVSYLPVEGTQAAPPSPPEDKGEPSHRTLREAVALVEKMGRVKVTFSPSDADEPIDFSVPAAEWTPDVIRNFDHTLEARGLALLSRGDSYEVIRFVAGGAEGRRPHMDVVVSQGKVELAGDQGSQQVGEGEESALEAGGAPAQPTPVAKARIGDWREAPRGQSPTVLTKVPLPALRVRRVGVTREGGLPIVECSLPAVDTGEGTVVEVEPTKVVLARDDDAVSVTVRVHLK